MKKRLIFLYSILSLALLVGCSSNNESSESGDFASSDEQTLTVWAWDTNFNIPIMEKAGEYYRKDGHDEIKVNVIEMSNEDTKQKMVSGFTSGVSEGLPDIVLMDDYDVQSYLTNYEGKFAELSDTIDFADFAEYKVENATYKEGIYAVPFDSGSAGLYYRTDYLSEAGYSEEDMKDLTWSQFVTIGEDVKEKTGKWFVAFIPNRGTHYLQMAMQSAGLWYFDEEGKIFLKDNPAIREMMPILKEIDQKELAKPVDYFAPEGIGAVTSGEVAAVNSAIWFSATIRSAEDQKGKWAYTHLPQLETVDGATPYSNLGGSSWLVLNDSPNKELAMDFLKTEFAGNDEFYQEILVENGAVGTYLPSQKGDAYQYKDPFFNDAPIYKDFSSWMAEIPGVDYGNNTQAAVDALRGVMQSYFDDALSLDEMLEEAENNYTMQVGE
ncbi:ABC transporter substrate-binding protein [Enterococcus gallinarum]|uniref:ABC transporter substrate-binding protein n=1 Tax=Enterococcus gallinarum TaxID=1353 RepID=UPI001E36E71D|nr:extracellular solute-binding protein [Enterococcus gallinarum]MCD5075587.1 carbohydrate ABC transporter substrate-binding protein [Enterococcus gallinarum]